MRIDFLKAFRKKVFSSSNTEWVFWIAAFQGIYSALEKNFFSGLTEFLVFLLVGMVVVFILNITNKQK